MFVLANISVFIIEKDSIIENVGDRQSWVAVFWSGPPLSGLIGVTPKQWIWFFFQIFSKHIDRRSCKISVPFVDLFCVERWLIRVLFNLTVHYRVNHNSKQLLCFCRTTIFATLLKTLPLIIETLYDLEIQKKKVKNVKNMNRRWFEVALCYTTVRQLSC